MIFEKKSSCLYAFGTIVVPEQLSMIWVSRIRFFVDTTFNNFKMKKKFKVLFN